MSVKFSNNATTELASSIGTSDTSITVVDASKFPILTAGDYTYVTLDTDTASPTREIVKVTAISGNVLTVTRGQDGTSPASFAAGTKVELRLTAALLNDVAGANPSGEPIGFPDKSQTTITFDSGTRTFSITPTGASFDVYCKGVKYTYTAVQLVTIPNTTGLHFIYFSASGVLSTQMSYFTWEEHAPTAYVYWNATTQQAIYFADERHGITLDWQTHEYLHRTRGAAIANGFAASGYTTTGLGATDADAQIDIGGGTFFDEDMQVDIVSTNTPVAGTWQQDLSGPARIPVLYLSGSAWVIDAPTNFPFKVVSSVPQYNLYSGGTWSTASVTNNSYFVSWILATNNLTYPVVSIISQAPTNQVSVAEAMTFEGLNLNGFPSVEFRPLYKVIYQYKDGFANSVKSSTIAVYDLRSISSAGVAAALVQDHGNLSGLTDDDHPQYVHTSEVRTPSAAVKNSFFPSQVGQTGKYLSTDGANTVWEPAPSGSLSFTGDVTGTGSTGSSVSLTLAASGVVAGQYTKVTVDAKGRVTAGTGVTSSDVTTALGYTPYNATNPAGYTTNVGTVTSVSGTGTVSGLTLTGSVTSSGSLTLGGTLSLTSGQVTSALGYTPYNATNPSGYITSSALSSYLPLSGGTLSGAVSAPNFHDANGLYNVNLGGINGRGAAAGYSGGAYGGVGYNVRHTATAEQYVAPTGDTVSYLRFDSGGFRFFSATAGAAGRTVTLSGSGNAFLDASGNWYAAGQMYATGSQHLVLNTGNYNDYAPSKTGTGASGTWSISITGNAATVTNGLYKSGTNTVPAAIQLNTTADNWMWLLQASGGNDWYLGPSTANFGIGANRLAISSSGGSANSELVLERGTTRLLEILQANLQYKGNVVLHAGNYNDYAPSKTGTGASGTWGISISGSAAQLNGRSVHQIFNNMGQNHITYTDFNNVPDFGAYYVQQGGNSPTGVANHQWYGFTLGLGNDYAYSSYASQLYWPRRAQNSDTYIYVRDREGGSWNGWTKIKAGYADTAGSATDSTKLPLSGGTLTGAIRAPQITAGGSNNTDANFGVQGTSHLTGTVYWGGTVGNVNSWSSISTSSGGTHTFSGSRFIFDRYGYGSQPLIDMQSSSITLSQPTYATNGITVNDAAANGRGINLYSGSPTSPTYGLFFAQTGNFGTYGAVSADWATYFTMNSTAHRGWIFREHDSLGNVAAISNQGNMTLRSHFEQGNNIARPNVSWSASSTSTGMVIFYLPGTTSNYGMVHMVFDIYEYNSNAVSTVIVGGHNWSTSWYNTSANVIGQCGKEVRLGCKDGRFCVVFGTSGSVWEYGTIVLRKIHNGSFYDNIMNMVGDWSATQTATESFTNITGDLRALRTPASFNAGGAITQAGNQVLHAGNYSSYAVALSGDQSIAGTKTFTTQIRTNRVEGTDGAFLFRIGIQSGTTRHLNLSDSTTDPASATTSIVGITWGSRDDTNPYYLIYPHYYSNGYSTHNRLRLAWHTGIEIGAASGYGGTRFFNNSPFAGSEIFSVGKGDDNVRVANSLYVQGDSRGQDVYTTGGWFRNHTNNNGIYWSQTGWHLYPADAGNFYVRSGTSAGSLLFLNSGGSGLGYVHAAADAAMGFLNTSGNWRLRVDNSGNTTCYNNLYLNQNYGHGHVGLYDSYRYQGVFFMGDAYKMSADGTSLANMYGIGWSHPNAGGAAGNLTDHGMLIINNGSFRCAISNSIVASGNITAYSDERLKKNWRDMPDNFVERLAQVRNGCYERIDDGMEQVGVSAQSLQKLLPEAILTAKDEIGTLSVSYGNAAMASAVELAKELVMLKKELAEIKSRLH